MITWYMEFVMTTAETGTLLPQVQVHHKIKGNGRNPEEIGSYRPLGLADPFLSLLSDILYDRLHEQIATYVGPNRQGGQTDPRFTYILQSDAKGVRNQMGLPTVESNADARPQW